MNTFIYRITRDTQEHYDYPAHVSFTEHMMQARVREYDEQRVDYALLLELGPRAHCAIQFQEIFASITTKFGK